MKLRQARKLAVTLTNAGEALLIMAAACARYCAGKASEQELRARVNYARSLAGWQPL